MVYIFSTQTEYELFNSYSHTPVAVKTFNELLVEWVTCLIKVHYCDINIGNNVNNLKQRMCTYLYPDKVVGYFSYLDRILRRTILDTVIVIDSEVGSINIEINNNHSLYISLVEPLTEMEQLLNRVCDEVEAMRYVGDTIPALYEEIYNVKTRKL